MPAKSPHIAQIPPCRDRPETNCCRVVQQSRTPSQRLTGLIRCNHPGTRGAMGDTTEVITMTMQEAQDRASRLGLSAWIGEAVAVGRDSSEIVEIMCIGFVSADLPIA